MTDFQLLNKISSLPDNLKKEVEDFIDFLNTKASTTTPKKKERTLGLMKGVITIKDNFDDPIEGFEDYT